jgi:hypothetical protein
LITPEGKPIEPAAGLAYYLDKLDEPAIPIFTNRKGQIRSEGFRPGKYRLEMDIEHYAPFEITIGPSQNNEVDLGTVQLKAK